VTLVSVTFAKTKSFVLCVILLSCIVSKPEKTSWQELEPAIDLYFCGLCFYNFLAESNNFMVFMVFPCHAYFSIYRHSFRRESNPGNFVGVVTFVSVISFLKQATLLLESFFCYA
jgi:hypothetical protein